MLWFRHFQYLISLANGLSTNGLGRALTNSYLQSLNVLITTVPQLIPSWKIPDSDPSMLTIICYRQTQTSLNPYLKKTGKYSSIYSCVPKITGHHVMQTVSRARRSRRIEYISPFRHPELMKFFGKEESYF